MYMPPNLHWSSTCKRAFGKSGAEQRVISDRKKVRITSRVTFVTHIPGMHLESSTKAPVLRSKAGQPQGISKIRSCWQSHHSGVLRPTWKSSLGFRSRLCHWGLPSLVRKSKTLPPLSWDYSNLPCSAFYMGAEAQTQSPHCCGKHFRLTISLALTFPIVWCPYNQTCSS